MDIYLTTFIVKLVGMVIPYIPCVEVAPNAHIIYMCMAGASLFHRSEMEIVVVELVIIFGTSEAVSVQCRQGGFPKTLTNLPRRMLFV